MARRPVLPLAVLALAGGAALWYIRQRRVPVAPKVTVPAPGKSNDLIVHYSGTVGIPLDVAAGFAREAVRRVLS